MTERVSVRGAQELLRDLGMDKARCNERSALTLLSLAGLAEGDPWSEATNEMLTTIQMMNWMAEKLGKAYKPNTRETIRRQTLHQFMAGGLVDFNADDPDRATNSSKNNYRIRPALLKVAHAVGTDRYPDELGAFLATIETWREQQDESREMHRVPVRMPDGSEVHLSAGGQNTLIKAMVEEFCPRFVPGGTVLYIDDTDKAFGAAGTEARRRLEGLGIHIPEHGKAPDLVVLDERHGWVFMMEACSTHGPIDVTRKRQLRELFAGAKAPFVYVSCFPSRDVMRRYLSDLAWETEAWCADNPDHMVHFNGERFMGPYEG